jgi:putative salt-induced outer membrane protein YdiY
MPPKIFSLARSLTCILRTLISAAVLSVFAPTVQAADAPASGTYQQGFEAGYKAAMEAMKSGPAPTMAVMPTAVPVAAATPPAGDQAKSDGPPDWWNHSALLYEKLDTNLRHHAELQFSGTSLSGNDAGIAIRASGKLFSRLDRWSNEALLTIDRRSINQSGVLNVRDYRMFQESPRYDLTKQFYASAGYIWETDDKSYIDNRNTWLGGVGFYVLDNPKMRLNTFVGVGRLNERYLKDIQTYTGLTSRSSGLLYLYQSFDWQISEDWSFQQGFRQIRDLDESGHYVLNTARSPSDPNSFPYVADSMVKRYRNVSNVALNYKLSPRSSLMLGIEQRYDSNPWPDVKSTDTIKRLTLNVMF